MASKKSKTKNSTQIFPLLIAGILTLTTVATGIIIGRSYDPRTNAATGTPVTVTIQNGKLYVDGSLYTIKGVNYNPTSVGSDQLDATAVTSDVPKIAALGANTVGTYMLGKAEYDTYSDITTGETFYNALYPVAEANNLKLIVGYFSNKSIDWTNTSRVAKVTSQYKALVNEAKNRPSTLVYMVGNEVFEGLSTDAQKKAYATWIGTMVDWTHTNDPKHPVLYTDSASHSGLSWLKTYAPNLDIYGVNNYTFTNASELTTIVANEKANWPGKAILLHEWGSDSYNVKSGKVDEAQQATRITQLATAIDSVTSSESLMGSLHFELTDEWRFVSSLSTQDPDAGWDCASCFDGKANEDYWGLLTNVKAGNASQRVTKPAYTALQEVWATDVTPEATSALTPTAAGATGSQRISIMPRRQNMQRPSGAPMKPNNGFRPNVER